MGRILGTRYIKIASNKKIVEKKNETTQYMKPQHQNNTFIDRKQCSLASSRWKPLAEQCSITMILKINFSYPLLLFILNLSIQKNHLEEDPSRNEIFYRVFLHLTYSSLFLGLINIGLYYM